MEVMSYFLLGVSGDEFARCKNNRWAERIRTQLCIHPVCGFLVGDLEIKPGVACGGRVDAGQRLYCANFSDREEAPIGFVGHHTINNFD